MNGTSSSGKSTLARALQGQLDQPFCYYASDQLADAGFRPLKDIEPGHSGRERFFDGFHRSIAAFAKAGNHLIVEHIIEEQRWADDLAFLLSPFNVFWVGVHATPLELERRERERGNRTIGEARFHLRTHEYCQYDLEVDSSRPLEEQVRLVIAGWRQRFVLARTSL